ncbi:MAG TPA: site-2 protease family protein [Candidatus Acidoferrum sp.]|nr:site-2 protease family protein [Candidatus Acidoferrum sp.]
MSTDLVEPIRNCHNCGAALPLGAVVCEQCHSLVHSEELVRISTRAKALEEQQQLLQAREEWLKALPLLPTHSTQAEWIRSQAQKLELAAKTAPPPEQKHAWARKLGPLAPIAVLLAKSKTLLLAIFKLKFIFSLFAFMGVYWALFGASFGIGFAVLILVHEMGHYIDIRRRGLPADMPVFFPGLGAYVRWAALGVTRQTRAAVSLAGPLAGFLGAAVCAALWYRTGYGLWAALARVSAGLNILNLTPIWVLDGGQAVAALSKAERFVLLAASLLLWLLLGEGIFFLVAAGVVYRLFTKDLPPQPSPAIATYFVTVLAALGLVLWLTPGQGLTAR